MDLHGVLGIGDLPDVAAGQPVVRHLDLIAVHQLLAEQAELIADGAAHGGQLQRGQGVQIAGGQAAQAAVAQAGLRLLFKYDGAVDAQLVQGLHVVFLVDEVDHVVVQRAAHQELGAEVIDLFGLLLLADVAGIAAALHDLVAHDHGQGLILLLGRGVADLAGKLGAQLIDDTVLDLLDRHPFKFHKTKTPPKKALKVSPNVTITHNRGTRNALRVVFWGGSLRFLSILGTGYRQFDSYFITADRNFPIQDNRVTAPFVRMAIGTHLRA